MLNDLLLIKRVKEGDIDAFETLFRRYHPPLVFFAATITGRTDVAEDTVQDIFYNIWKERDKINIISSLKSYLYSAVRNRSIQYRERLKLDNKYIDSLTHSQDSCDSADTISAQELEQLLYNTMDKMPERRLAIFKMHRFQNLKYKEIAENLSLSVKTVEAEMTKALKTLRKEIEYHTNIS